MGYYTTYNFGIKKGNDALLGDVIAAAEEMSGYKDVQDSEGVKWYEHEAHMKAVSRMYPSLTIELHGVGEGYDDMWRKYFKNGKMQVCMGTIVYPEFDEELLE